MDGDGGVEEPPIRSRNKEELPWERGSFLVVLFDIPGVKDREIA
jgi:hypothetical protein